MDHVYNIQTDRRFENWAHINESNKGHSMVSTMLKFL